MKNSGKICKTNDYKLTIKFALVKLTKYFVYKLVKMKLIISI